MPPTLARLKSNPKLKNATRKLSKKQSKPMRTSNFDSEIKDLEARIILQNSAALTPETGESVDEPPSDLGPALTARLFTDLPLSRRTLRGLKAAEYVQLTSVQTLVIPQALGGANIMGEAPTGSGKTLAFVIPLFRSRWERGLGLAALVITPTRELAAQIFGIVKSVGQFHGFSVGCLIGGKHYKYEAREIEVVNVVIATPGRLLQHLDESEGFDTSSLSVLDEADQLVDLGFSETISNILSQLPPSDTRQTMLFSATLNYSVRRLAMLSVPDAKQVTVTAGESARPTPSKLKEMYLIVELSGQLNTLFSFLRSHSQKRIIVFVSSCKQVRFVYESFSKLKCGPAVFELHGRQSQLKRLEICNNFSAKKHAACLICTDIAARGLDFEGIDWVVQLNCPLNVETYIHRVGRTARYHSEGHSLLFLQPSEVHFLKRLNEKSISPESLHMNPEKSQIITGRLASLVASNAALKHLGQRALISYFRSIILANDKAVFDCSAMIPNREAAESIVKSFGLALVPMELISIMNNVSSMTGPSEKVKKMSKLERLKEKIALKKSTAEPLESEIFPEEDLQTNSKKVSKAEKRRQRLKGLRSITSNNDGENCKDENEANDDFLTPMPKCNLNEEFSSDEISFKETQKLKTRIQKNQIRIRADGTAKIKGFASLNKEMNKKDGHVFFDDEDGIDSKVTLPFEHAIASMGGEIRKENHQIDTLAYQSHLQKLREKMSEARVEDKLRDKERIHEAHLKKRDRKKREKLSSTDAQSFVATLGNAEDFSSTEQQVHMSKKRGREDLSPSSEDTKKAMHSITDMESKALELLSF